MNKTDLRKQMVKKGIRRARARALINQYAEIKPFSYNDVVNDSSNNDYQTPFGQAYKNYGIYIFYTKGTKNIQYIGEAASETFSKRLTQHFNNSHGGLRFQKKNESSTLESCEILILYRKHNKSQARETHFDEDLLIGTFRPPLNKR